MKLPKPNGILILLASAVGLLWSVAGYLLNSEDLTDATLSVAQLWLRIGMSSIAGMLMGAYFGALATLSSMYYSRRMFLPFMLLLLFAMLFGVLLTAPRLKSEQAHRSMFMELAGMFGLPAVLAVSAASLGYCLRWSDVRQEASLCVPTNQPTNPSGGSSVS